MNIRNSFENITSSTAAHTAATRFQVLKGFPQAPGNKQPSNEQEGLDLLTFKFTNLIQVQLHISIKNTRKHYLTTPQRSTELDTSNQHETRFFLGFTADKIA